MRHSDKQLPEKTDLSPHGESVAQRRRQPRLTRLHGYSFSADRRLDTSGIRRGSYRRAFASLGVFQSSERLLNVCALGGWKVESLWVFPDNHQNVLKTIRLGIEGQSKVLKIILNMFYTGCPVSILIGMYRGDQNN